ncbi:MAG: thermonuclease family protein [Phycisphaerales bacterium]
MKNKNLKYAQSRLRKKLLTLSAFLFIAALGYLDHKYNFLGSQKPAISQTQDANDWDKYNQKTFVGIKAVDGDTIDINIPDGKYRHTRIRMLGIDTPETKNPNMPVMYFGPEAYNFTKGKILGKNITVLMDLASNPRDKYGRLLAHIELEDGSILNKELLTNGFAYADTRFPHSFKKEYVALEKQAQKEKRGLWKNITLEQMPKWRQRTGATKALRH